MEPQTSVTRILLMRHLAAVAVVAVLALGVQILLHRALEYESAQREAARAGERLMAVAQRLQHSGLVLLSQTDPALLARNREQLEHSLDGLQKLHASLRAERPLDAEETQRLEESFGVLVATTRSLLSPGTDPGQREPLARRLEQAGTQYAAGLGQVVDRLQARADQRTLLYRYLSLALVTGLLVALLLDTMFVFRPAVERISRTIGDLEGVRRQLRDNLEALRNSHQLIKADLKAAARIQRSLLPNEPPEVPGVEVAWIFDSCDEVAGDMFNVFRLDENHLGLYILDVCGHGVQAAMLSVSVTRALSPLPTADGLLKRRVPGSYQIVPPAEVARELNRRFPVMAQSDQFFTFLYGILDLRNGRFTYVRAGHQGPVHMSGRRSLLLDGPVGLPIGIEEDADYEEEAVDLTPGDLILFYTDGVTDLQSSDGKGFGRDRMLGALGENRELGVSAALYTLRQRMESFREGGRQRDDISMLGLGMLQPAESPHTHARRRFTVAH